MQTMFSTSSSTPMAVRSRVISSQSQRFTFVDQTGQPSSVESSKTQRRIVRSNAMVDVRRRQMVQLANDFRLRWTDPKIVVEDDKRGCERSRPVAYDYDFVDQTFEAEECVTEKDVDARRRTKNTLVTSRRTEPRIKGSKSLDSASAHRVSRQFLPRPRETTKLGSGEDPKLPTTSGLREWHTSSIATPTMPPNALRMSSPLMSMLGAGRVNPFENFPVDTDQGLYELTDHYTVMIPILMYGTRCRNPVQRSFYYLAINDPAAFHTMLAFAARHLDALHGATRSNRAIHHTIKAVRAVIERLQEDASPLGDWTVFSVAVLAITERRFGCREISHNHWVGLKEIITRRGGLISLGSNPTLGAMIAWNYMVWSGRKETASDPLPVNWPSLASTSLDDRSDLERACEEFIEFFRDLESIFLYLNFSSSTSSTHSYVLEHRRRIFAPDSHLHTILSFYGLMIQNDMDPSSSNHYQRQRTSKACQMPCLVYLNIAMLDYADEPTTCEKFLNQLEACTLEDDEGRSISPEHLLIRLLIGLEEVAGMERRPDRVQDVVRLTDMFKRLNNEWSCVAYDVLWKALSVDSTEALCSASRTGRLFDVDLDILRLEILGSNFL